MISYDLAGDKHGQWKIIFHKKIFTIVPYEK